MWQRVGLFLLRAFGRGTLFLGMGVAWLLWELIAAPFREAGRGLTALWRRVAPFLLLGGMLFLVGLYDPMLGAVLLQFGLTLGIMGVGFYLMLRPLWQKPKRKKKK
jgi:hypothetical protein